MAVNNETKGDDTINAGNGGGVGSLAATPGDVYDGGAGIDTLNLSVTSDEMATLLADIAHFNAPGDKTVIFSFTATNLDVKNIETISATPYDIGDPPLPVV